MLRYVLFDAEKNSMRMVFSLFLILFFSSIVEIAISKEKGLPLEKLDKELISRKYPLDNFLKGRIKFFYDATQKVFKNRKALEYLVCSSVYYNDNRLFVYDKNPKKASDKKEEIVRYCITRYLENTKLSKKYEYDKFLKDYLKFLRKYRLYGRTPKEAENKEKAFLKLFSEEYFSFKKRNKEIMGGKRYRRLVLGVSQVGYYILTPELSERLTLGIGGGLFGYYGPLFSFDGLFVGATSFLFYMSGRGAFEGTLMVFSFIPFIKYNLFWKRIALKNVIYFYLKAGTGVSYLSLDNRVLNEKVTSIDFTSLLATGISYKFADKFMVFFELGIIIYKETITASGISEFLGASYSF